MAECAECGAEVENGYPLDKKRKRELCVECYERSIRAAFFFDHAIMNTPDKAARLRQSALKRNHYD